MAMVSHSSFIIINTLLKDGMKKVFDILILSHKFLDLKLSGTV
jgi:hypothetical protein